MADAAPDLEDRLRAVCGHLNAAHAQLVDLVAEAMETGAWAQWGIRSVHHWLCWQAGVSRATAERLVRLAEAKVTHPQTSAVFVDGGLTLDQAALAVTAPDHLDAEFAVLAPLSTVHQLRVEVRAAATTMPPQPPTADDQPPTEPAEPAESVTAWFDADGRYHLRAELDAEHGRVVDAALTETRDRLFHEGRPDVSWADALVDVATGSMGAVSADRRERFRVNLFLDPAVAVGATWSDGTFVPDAIRRHVTCDGGLSPVFTAGAAPVSVGRTQRVVPERTRRIVERRDGGCRVPWCSATRWLQVHHIVHWEDGGPTDTANLIALCAACHRHHHHGNLGITGDADQPDGLTFTGPDGRIIDPAARPTKPTGPPPEPQRPYEHPLGERLDRWSLQFPDPPASPPPEPADAA